jgi:hypothetical protein
MEIKALLCNCKSLCASLKNTDTNGLPFQVEGDFDVQYAGPAPSALRSGRPLNS